MYYDYIYIYFINTRIKKDVLAYDALIKVEPKVFIAATFTIRRPQFRDYMFISWSPLIYQVRDPTLASEETFSAVSALLNTLYDSKVVEWANSLL